MEYYDEELSEEDNNQLQAYEDKEEYDENRNVIASISGWGISLITHGVIAMLLMYIYILGELEKERPPLKLTQLDHHIFEEDKDPIEEKSFDPIDITVVADINVEIPLVTKLDLPVEEIHITEDEVDSNDAKGREEAISNAEAGGTAAFLSIGAGGGGAGMYGNRKGGSRQIAAGRLGGSRRSELAVESSLRWFRKHQSPNGMWDVDGYPDNCVDQPKCEPGQAYTDAQGDIASTAYAILCFLGAGYDHVLPNKYRTVVHNGIEWLKSQAGPAPSKGIMFGNNRRMYHNAIATMALAEAYAMTSDPRLRKVTQDAVDFIVAEQNADPKDEGGYRLGWNYTPSATRQDSSIFGWAIMALKAAESGGLNTGNSMEGARNYLVRAWRDANPHWQNVGSDSMTLFPYTWNPVTGETSPTAGVNGSIPGNGRTVCVGGLAAVFLGYTQGDPMLESMLNTVTEKQFPTEYPTNTYYLYYNSISIFQGGGDRFEKWNNTVRDMLVESQRRDGCFDGSWDWAGTKFHGHNVGRIVSTAYVTLTLQVYYRYVRIGGK